MAQYIDKDALVAEIEKRRKDWWYGSSIEAKYKREECDDILSFIDTLEVKDVDLEKEIREYLSTYWPIEKELHPFLGHMAKYFFNLGLKAQKGESV